MFPLRAVHSPRSTPHFTRGLVAANAFVFLIQLLSPYDLAATLGVRPVCFFSPGSCGIALSTDGSRLLQPLLGSLFLHGGFLHLAFNMLFLWVFGAGLEDKLGSWRFALLYFACGLGASLTHIITHPFSPVPSIGASGAIAGVLGAYFLLQPKSWILTYFPPIFVFPLPAPVFLLIWIVTQIFSAVTNLPFLHPSSGSDIAWMAHIGGFFAGVLFARQLKAGRQKLIS